MVDSNSERLPGAPLPSSVVELQARRLEPFKRLLNDMVEELHTKCYEDEKYRAYLEAFGTSSALKDPSPPIISWRRK